MNPGEALNTKILENFVTFLTVVEQRILISDKEVTES
jgi:hypothetical protein